MRFNKLSRMRNALAYDFAQCGCKVVVFFDGPIGEENNAYDEGEEVFDDVYELGCVAGGKALENGGDCLYYGW